LHIVTRWKRDNNGIKIVREGSYMLEMVAIKKARGEAEWAIPEVKRNLPNSKLSIDDTVDPTSPIIAHAFNEMNKRSDVTDPEFKMLEQNIHDMLNEVGVEARGEGEAAKFGMNGPRVIYAGRMGDDDTRGERFMTVKVEWFHDDGNLFDAFDLKHAKEPAVEVAWIPVHTDMDLCGEQEQLLEYVAHKSDAYWSSARY